ncbi:MAG: hypothetical protein Q4F30_10065 [Akkermansia sp.]|nr:hypothetical protein [Akkermansia sp.]
MKTNTKLSSLFAIAVATCGALIAAEPNQKQEPVVLPDNLVHGMMGHSRHVLVDSRGCIVMSYFIRTGKNLSNRVRGAADSRPPLHLGKVVKEDGFQFFLIPVHDTLNNPEGSSYILAEAYYKNNGMFIQTYGHQVVHLKMLSRDPQHPDFRLPEARQCVEWAKMALREQAGELHIRENKEELKTRMVLYEKMEADLREKKKQEELRQKQERLEKEPGYADELLPYNGYLKIGREVAAKLGMDLPRGTPSVLNVHRDILTEWDLGKLLLPVLNTPGKKGGRFEYCKGKGPINDLGGIFSRGETNVHVYLAFDMYDASQATRVMLALSAQKNGDGDCLTEPDAPKPGQKYSNSEHILTPDEIAERIEVLRKPPVGESAVRLRQLMDAEGLPVKGSEKRSIYFTRGNTAVGVWTEDPTFNVLPVAREIDRLLADMLRQAGVPLTQEQDYLKEDKGQE